MPLTPTAYDLVILGAGSTAFAAALAAAEMGKTVVMTEDRTVGGTCVNRGCLPSKNLIEAARLVWEAQHPRYPGLRPTRLAFDFHELVRQKDDVIRDYRQRKYTSLVDGADRIEIVRGRAALVDPYTVLAGERHLRGNQVLIATGSRPALPVVDGLDQVPYLTSDLLAAEDPAALPDLPASLIILGGGYIALELGQMFSRFGSQVTLLERSRRVLPGYEPEVSQAVAQALRAEGIELITSARVQRVDQDGAQTTVGLQTPAGRQKLSAERLLVAAGRTPNTEGLGLETVGVGRDGEGYVRVDNTLRTSVPHIWAAGDVIGPHTGSQMATPVGAHDGRLAAQNALGGTPRPVDHRVIPRAIFTDPQVAVAGLTEAEANALGHRYWSSTVPVSLVPRAGAVHAPQGIAKMVIDDDTRRVLGVSLVMRDAAEVIHAAAMGLRLNATLHDFIDLVYVYPSMAEALKLAAISRFKDPAKLSCCAA